MAREMQTHESKRECVGSSRMCSGSRRSRGRTGAGACKPAGVGAARAAAARRGEAGKGQREAGKAACKAQEGTWHGLEQREGGPVRGTWPARAEKTESRGLEVDEGGSICNFPKVLGLLYKA
jgi:hypothetical protein